MSNHWPPGTMKIHEGCGGLVRWVEAVKRPGVGYTGHCLACDAEDLPVEQLVPIQTEQGEHPHEIVTGADRDDLRELTWDDEADWDANQARLREAIL